MNSNGLGTLSETSRSTLSEATEQARQLRANHVGTEHLLLGLLAEGHGRGARLLADVGVQLADARAGVERLIGPPGDQPVDDNPPFTARLTALLENARLQATWRHHEQLDTEHLLLALLDHTNSLAVNTLEDLGVDTESLYRTIETAVGDAEHHPRNPVNPGYATAVRLEVVVERLDTIAHRLDTMDSRLAAMENRPPGQ